jgi:DNA-binding PadR family transcriptional regulator
LWLESKKHKPILDDLESNGLISKHEIQFGKRTVTVYKPTVRGIEFYRSILEPYEKMFPRSKLLMMMMMMKT